MGFSPSQNGVVRIASDGFLSSAKYLYKILARSEKMLKTPEKNRKSEENSVIDAEFKIQNYVNFQMFKFFTGMIAEVKRIACT